MEQTSLYCYRTIDADTEMRVLILQPATSFDEPLVSSMLVQKIQPTIDDLSSWDSATQPFDCVSYCWGQWRRSERMDCDGQHLDITSNVEELLRYLRKALKPRYLWIDALCINQADNVEKAKQVASMGLIYARAAKVRIWLGPATAFHHTAHIFSILRYWVTAVIEGTVEDLSLTAEQMMTHLGPLLGRPWFTRRWIIQEVKLARAATVHWGPHRLSWEWVRDGMTMLHTEHFKHTDLDGAAGYMPLQAAQALETAVSLHVWEESPSIFDLLWSHHASLCTDDRDRIFALYGILPQIRHALSETAQPSQGFDPRLNCPVHYAKKFQSIYTQLAVAAVESGLGSKIIAHALAFGKLADLDPSWPSWVPSWNTARHTRMELPLKKLEWELCPPSLPSTTDEDDRRPVLRTSGKTYRITETKAIEYQDNVSSQSVMEFFKTTLRSFQMAGTSSALRPIAVSLLLRSIRVAKSYYNRAPLSTKSILAGLSRFVEVSVPGPRGTRMNDFPTRGDRLISALRNELGSVFVGPSFTYSSETLCAEVDRILQGWTLVRYEFEDCIAPGIAFAADVHPGDVVFCSQAGNRMEVSALVLRPEEPDPDDLQSGRAIYRLVGCCVENPHWAHEIRDQTIQGAFRNLFTATATPVKDVYIV